MKVQLAVLADCANIAPIEKLNVMGVFDTIWAASFPAAHPFMVLALRFRFEYEDGESAHVLVISLRDEDEKEYLRAEANVQIPKIPAGQVAHFNQILNLAAFAFTRAGRYAFHITWDGAEATRVDLNIVQGAPPTP